MAKKTSIKRVGHLFFIVAFLLFHLFAKKTDKMDLDHLYKMAQFSRIVAHLNISGFDALSSQDKFLYIECLARSGQRSEAERLWQKTRPDNPLSCTAHVTAGILHTSLGQFKTAQGHLEQALLINEENPKAQMAMTMLELYLQKYQEALQRHEEFLKGDPEWAESYVSHLLGIEVYGAVGDIAKIAGLYELQAAQFKKLDEKQHQNFRKNAQLYRRQSKKKAFQIKTNSDKVSLPFVNLTNKDRYAAISLQIKDKHYKVLLDTGNRVGWTIHSRELEKRLKHRPGGTALTQMGTDEGMLHGHLLLTKQLDFQDLRLQHMPGMFIPKPYPDYPEANLNPLFIKDRVVTLDFINKEMILRTDERFHDDLAKRSSPSKKGVTFTWYGYEFAFIPVVVNGGAKALAMIETGAEDITVNLDFARLFRWALEPAIKFLPTGKEFPCFKTPFRMNIGHFSISRKKTDVWSFEKLSDPLTGLLPDILLGPDLFKERFVLTFDPYRKIILITEFSF